MLAVPISTTQLGTHGRHAWCVWGGKAFLLWAQKPADQEAKRFNVSKVPPIARLRMRTRHVLRTRPPVDLLCAACPYTQT